MVGSDGDVELLKTQDALSMPYANKVAKYLLVFIFYIQLICSPEMQCHWISH